MKDKIVEKVKKGNRHSLLRHMPRINLLISGHVQGVGFRFFTSRTANSLGLKGYAKNLSNGKVEIVAEGSKQGLEKFLKRIAEGPITADIENIEVKWEKETCEFKGFGMKY